VKVKRVFEKWKKEGEKFASVDFRCYLWDENKVGLQGGILFERRTMGVVRMLLIRNEKTARKKQQKWKIKA